MLAEVVSNSRAMAAGAEAYPTLSALKSATFYRLTCSDVKSSNQAHIYIEVNNGTMEDVKLVTISPALSLNVLQYSKEDLKGLAVTSKETSLEIQGLRPGAYYDETLSLTIADGKHGLQGILSYDDGDGASLQRTVKCGAVNYVLMPSR
ncbi:hypothetical protein, partial [Bdellovibrio sp.]|uniref:hypothetical protein n=1 Tax=Bdellovibrio sp. TaxID=28201 RepID=UPI0039E5E1BA